MPLYEYECDACGQRFEVIQKFSDPAPEACRLCGKGPVHRQASSPAIQFKGSGFYITDYAQKGRSDPSSTTSSDKGTDGAKSDSSATASTDGSKSKSDVAWGDSAKSDSKSDSAKSDSSKSDSSKSDSAKSDAGPSSPKPSTSGASKESKK
jgi:putative FmdB family regulatory protein